MGRKNNANLTSTMLSFWRKGYLAVEQLYYNFMTNEVFAGK